MNKKLPKVFANKIDKSLNNNDKVFYSSKDFIENEVIDDRSINKNNLNINQKINSIFSSPRYVYKADVNITTRDSILSKRIIGRNGTHLITIDNELIAISDILDIDFIE